jgi:hypothetical protein
MTWPCATQRDSTRLWPAARRTRCSTPGCHRDPPAELPRLPALLSVHDWVPGRPLARARHEARPGAGPEGPPARPAGDVVGCHGAGEAPSQPVFARRAPRPRLRAHPHRASPVGSGRRCTTTGVVPMSRSSASGRIPPSSGIFDPVLTCQSRFQPPPSDRTARASRHQVVSKVLRATWRRRFSRPQRSGATSEETAMTLRQIVRPSRGRTPQQLDLRTPSGRQMPY